MNINFVQTVRNTQLWVFFLTDILNDFKLDQYNYNKEMIRYFKIRKSIIPFAKLDEH